MKLVRIIFLLVCVSSFAQAQTKVGTIDVDFVLSKMPEINNVQKQVEDYGKGLEADLQKKMNAYQEEIKKYTADEATLTINQRKARQDSIIGMENDITKFQQNGNQLIVLKREEYMQPLYTKLGAALEKVAQAEGYTQVLLRNNDVVYVDNRFDLTIAVLKEMGIEVKEGE
ncbi:OmpH family outer membrane protein [Aureisphaera galaxeae]|uniref:OmpH family outer membrane protein n=1 Tax=Aureisphaera galaxeae TaxID=1538023 RepID=UPI002350C61B|nr:OmpH family outer membrane protein [Aureisphaera galaxeae]MDC8006358.1 OmpH family outer membrane protein [Aureisphaera galaxeae]